MTTPMDTYRPGLLGAVTRMAYAGTREEAEDCARQAADCGATPVELAAIWVTWERLFDQSVQTLRVNA